MSVLRETDRLIIRHFESDDESALFQITKHPDVMHYSVVGPKSEQENREFLQKQLDAYESPGFGICAIIHKDEHQMIGYGGVQPFDLDGHIEIEIAYRLLPEFWNQGYGTEAAMAIKQYAFDTLAFNRLAAVVSPKNEHSLKIAEKLGMYYDKDTIYNGFPVRLYLLDRFGPRS